MQGELESLAQKVEKVLTLLDKLKSHNTLLRQENEELKAELAAIRKDQRSLKLSRADQSAAARSRLKVVLDRLEELESLHR